MLEVNKSMTLNGISKVDGQPVVYMSATISTDTNGSSTVTKNVCNKELYDSNKSEIRRDMSEFEQEVYRLEDGLAEVNVDEVE